MVGRCDGTVYVTGTLGRSRVNVFAARDLKNGIVAGDG
jgi:hypothetical protein